MLILVCGFMCVGVCLYTCVRMCLHVYQCVCARTHDDYVCVLMHGCMYVYMCVFISTGVHGCVLQHYGPIGEI